MSTATASIQEQAIERLASLGKISEADVMRGRNAARAARDGNGLVYHLVELHVLTLELVHLGLQEVTGELPVNLAHYPLQADLQKVLTRDEARTLRAVPIGSIGGRIQVAVEDNFNLEAARAVQGITGTDVQLCLTDEHSLTQRIAQLPGSARDSHEGHHADAIAQQAVSEIGAHRAKAATTEAFDATASRASISQLVDRILAEGVRRGASDIHIEFFRAAGRVRYRVDGVLAEWETRLPPEIADDLVNRIKILSRSMDSTNNRAPQDGRIRRKLPVNRDTREVEFRVSTLPTVRGEKTVLRILDQSEQPLDFAKLGIEGDDADKLLRAMKSTTGMILLTGPTGSGKSTTLYSILNQLAQPEVNAITVEDPVEREIEGVIQVNVRPADNSEVNLSYTTVLKAMLRQDPDILMVGEIRDAETAQIASRAAMTGHLILSTIHTNDAPGTITRLLDMGLEPYNIVGALRLVIAQRLVRRICSQCREEYTPEPEIMALAGGNPQRMGNQKFYRGAGCASCNNSGYKGRVGIYEMLEINDRIKPLILARKDEKEIAAVASQTGMVPLKMAGLNRVRQGLTTLEEIVKRAG